MIIRPTIKPLPYYTVAGTIDYSELARSLRMEFVPKLGRRFIVYMDDVLVLCEDSHQCAAIYAFLDNYLSFNYALSWNVNKTVSGQFSRTRMSFCGWQETMYAKVQDADKEIHQVAT